MRICFVSTLADHSWGGSELLWSATARRALEEGHQVATITHRSPSPPEAIRDLRARGARVFFRSPNRDVRVIRAFEQLIYPLPRVRRWKPDVLCLSHGDAYEIALFQDVVRFQEACGVPYVAICQHHSDGRIPPERMRSPARSWYQRAAHVVFVAAQNRRTVERQLASALPHSHVVCNPVNLRRVEAVAWPESAELGLANVGRLEPHWKGQDVLFEVLSQSQWAQRSWRLRLYGSGNDRPYLEALAKHFSIASRLEFAGHVSDVAAIWATNHLLVMPSRSEGTPLALVEAMVCARPAVVSDVGGNLEWVSEPETGFIAEAPTVRSFGAALERAWHLRDSWKEIGGRAHEVAIRKQDPSPDKTLLTLLLDAAQRKNNQLS
jgi:glycosyltransferase involved in cell wall biosynthesis